MNLLIIHAELRQANGNAAHIGMFKTHLSERLLLSTLVYAWPKSVSIGDVHALGRKSLDNAS